MRHHHQTHPNHTQPNRTEHVLPLGLFLVFFGSFVLPLLAFTCAHPPECKGDRDCVERLGSSYACFVSKCIDRSKLPEKPKFEIPPDEPNPEPEPQPEQVIEPEQVIGPEQVIEPDTTPVQDGLRALFEPCLSLRGAAPKDRCRTGLVCVRVNSLESRCLQDCTDNASVCATNTDGRNECTRVSYERYALSAIRVCAKFAQKDENCDPRQAVLCARNQNPHLICISATCSAARILNLEGEDCSDGQSPPVECNADAGLACDPSTNKCVKGVPAFEGDRCDRNNPSSGVRRVCERAHSCVGFTNNGQSIEICLKDCKLSDPLGTCLHKQGANMICRAFGPAGYCVERDCKSQADCKLEGHSKECSTLTDQSKICFPLPPEGTRKAGELCNTTPAQACEHPFNCVPTTTAGAERRGYCGAQCLTNEDCASMPFNASCNLNRQDGIRLCGYSCAKNEDCPKGLVCGNGRFCTAP
ncbi:hypothetical protein L6R29_06755 [Myxococcota bacterium]|nr:hypothetical protein [Myxococcota bacterium]